MGAIEHNVMAAVTCDDKSYERITDAILLREDRGKFLFYDVRTNGYKVVIVPPDGSKHDFPESERGDVRRRWLAAQIEADHGRSAWDWCDMCFGWYGARIEATNCKEDGE